MSNMKRLFLTLAAVVIFVAIISLINRPGKNLASSDLDYDAIENTLRSYLEIDAEARYTLDDTRLSEVLANDPRGSYNGVEGANKYLVQAVRWYTGNPDISEDNIGMLDFWHAYYAYRRALKQIYDTTIGRELLPTPSPIPYEDDFPLELRVTPNPTQVALPEFDSLPEVKELMEATGFQAASLPPPEPVVILPQQFTIESISVDNVVAHIIGDYPYAKVDLTFVNLSGQWYLVGEKIIQWHGR